MHYKLLTRWSALVFCYVAQVVKRLTEDWFIVLQYYLLFETILQLVKCVIANVPKCKAHLSIIFKCAQIIMCSLVT